MRAPRRRFKQSLAIVGLALGCVVVAFLLPDVPERIGVPIALACVGMLGTIVGGLSLAWSRAAARVEQSLRAGHEVIGQWRVDPSTWQQFVALNQTFSINQVSVPATIPGGGIEVVFSPRGLLIGDQIETFNRSQRMDGGIRRGGGDWTVTQASLGGDRPCCLYLYAGLRGTGAPSFVNLIVPVPSDAVDAARRVLDHFLAEIRLGP